MYTVKEVSKKVGISEHTIRFYADSGLVPNLKRNSRNIRLFDEQSIEWIEGTKCLRGCGMSLQSIKDYIELCLQGDSTIENRYEIILEQQKIVNEKLQEIIESSKYINNKAEYYEKLVNKELQDLTNPAKKQ